MTEKELDQFWTKRDYYDSDDWDKLDEDLDDFEQKVTELGGSFLDLPWNGSEGWDPPRLEELKEILGIVSVDVFEHPRFKAHPHVVGTSYVLFKKEN
jgi:hypothetical protein